MDGREALPTITTADHVVNCKIYCDQCRVAGWWQFVLAEIQMTCRTFPWAALCMLIDNRFAWISKVTMGKLRMFS